MRGVFSVGLLWDLFLVINVVRVRLLVMFSVVWYMFRKWFMFRIRLMFSGFILIIV